MGEDGKTPAESWFYSLDSLEMKEWQNSDVIDFSSWTTNGYIFEVFIVPREGFARCKNEEKGFR